MANYNFESQPEGDWDDRGSLSWCELDWQKFLQRQETEIARFLCYYDDCPAPDTERLDWVARQMGWDSEDWSVNDFLDDDDEDDETESWTREGAEENSPMDSDPYTLHRHPVYVVCSGLFLQLRYHWRQAILEKGAKMDTLLSWDFADSLSEAEKHSLMAMQSMDFGDLLLCVIHMKRAMRGINLGMSLLPQLFSSSQLPAAFERSLYSRLFDLREVSLRVISDCRQEERR